MFLSTCSISAIAQNEKRTECCCSSVIKQLSEGWKKDSLANNDFRINNVKFFHSCILDTISIDLLLHYLGAPSRKDKISGGVQYEYFYYDIRTKPKNFDGPRAAAGVVFLFADGYKYVKSITESDWDL